METQLILDSNVTADYKEALVAFAEGTGCSLSTSQINTLAPALLAMVKQYPLPFENTTALISSILKQLDKNSNDDILTILVFQEFWIKTWKGLS